MLVGGMPCPAVTGMETGVGIGTFMMGTGTAAGFTDASVFGGATPNAAFVICTNQQAADDPAESPHAVLSIGAADASSNDRSAGTSSNSGAASTSVFRRSDTSHSIRPVRSGGVNIQGNGDPVVNGFSWTSTSSTNVRTMASIFDADDAAVGTISLGTGTSAIAVACGFEPDLVILFGDNGPFDTNASFFGLSFGIALNDGTQRMVGWAEANNAAAGAPFQGISTSAAGGQVDATGGLAYSVVIGGFGPTGFTATPSSSAGGDELGYLALRFADRNVALVDFDTPTATGSASITGASFTPSYAMIVTTNLETVNSFAGFTSDLQSGLGISFVSVNDQTAASWRIDSGADPTSTASYCQDGVSVIGASATSCQAIKATFGSFVSGGISNSYSAVQGSAKKGFALFIE